MIRSILKPGSLVLLLTLLLGAATPVSAHYLWVTIGKDDVANVIFEHGPATGDGGYIDRFIKRGETWVRTVNRLKPAALKVTDHKVGDKRWLTAKLKDESPRSVDSYGKFGVYAYGKTNVLLHYYARNLDVETHEDLHELARAPQLDLDIVPHDHGKNMELTILWKGKPVAGRRVSVIGPKGVRLNLDTDERGEVEFAIEHEGRYALRTFVEEESAGVDNDEPYSLIRHHATMLINLPMKK
ncbi:MAG: DUF4198 domain-containing protein [bacterium]|nr:DUF4198 domain-containing protein [bacterium]